MSNHKTTISIPWLDELQPCFPDTSNALLSPPGLLAAGGNLNPDTLLDAYRRGIFPWYNANEPILWWSPEPRCVLFCDRFHASRSLRKLYRKSLFTISFDSCFEQVMLACADRDETWINQDMLGAYQQLHQLGFAHSIEVFSGSELVGGLYGLAIGSVFYGESMFSRQNNASKYALWCLSNVLYQQGFRLIDCQQETPHLISLGACSIPRHEFESILAEDTTKPSILKSAWPGLATAIDLEQPSPQTLAAKAPGFE